MVCATFVFAAWAAQPDGLPAIVGEVAGQLFYIIGWMPPGLDEEVVRVS
jgi:hypothetical protein